MNFCFLLCVRRQSQIGPRERKVLDQSPIIVAASEFEQQAFSLHCQGRRGKLPEYRFGPFTNEGHSIQHQLINGGHSEWELNLN